MAHYIGWMINWYMGVHKLGSLEVNEKHYELLLFFVVVVFCCCCSPSETYGRKWDDSNFQILAELTVPPQGGWSLWNILMCFIYIYHCEHYGLSFLS